MQHLCTLVLLPRQAFTLLLRTCQGQVSFFALHRIEPHPPPLVQSPLQPSSKVVSNAISELSSELSHPTYLATYAPFTPSESEQRLGPLYYRGCWHRVSRPFLFRYYQVIIS